MYRVILADDEPFITKGLKKMIDWESLNAEIIGEAENGTRLMELIRVKEPDIIVSDIEMPEQNGLDVIREIKEQGLATKVILLSAYQEFSYAKDAITYGAVDYLVKPVRREDLINSIRKAKNLLQKEDSTQIWSKETIEKAPDFINHKREFSYEKVMEYFEKHHIITQDKSLVGICFSLSQETIFEINNDTKFELMKFAIFKSIQDYIEKKKLGIVIKRSDRWSSSMFAIPKGVEKKELEKELQELRALLFDQYEVTIVIGIGDFISDCKYMKYAYKSAIFAAELYYFQQQDTIYYNDIKREYRQSFDDIEKANTRLINCIMERKEEWKKYLRDCFTIIENLHYGNRNAVENKCIILVTDLYRELLEYRLIKSEEQVSFERFINNLRVWNTYQQLKKYMEGQLDELITRIKEKPVNRDKLVIRQVRKYIEEHYWEEVKMDQVASHVYMNQSYFSTFFKKETGENCKDYLVKVRMKEAKKLLLENDMKTYEIANAVGYNDVRSFSDKFKEIYGDSPSVYKKEKMK